MMYKGFRSHDCGYCRSHDDHTAEQHTSQFAVRVLPVGGDVVIGDWVVTRTRFDRFVLTGYPVKLGGRTRFGTIGDMQEDLIHIDQMGALPPVVKVGF